MSAARAPLGLKGNGPEGGTDEEKADDDDAAAAAAGNVVNFGRDLRIDVT